MSLDEQVKADLVEHLKSKHGCTHVGRDIPIEHLNAAHETWSKGEPCE